MGEVYERCNQKILRFAAEQDGALHGIAMGVIVPARRGKHLAVPYGPVVRSQEALVQLVEALCAAAQQHDCAFVRMSPFMPSTEWAAHKSVLSRTLISSPLHLLGEHIWYLPLTTPDLWAGSHAGTPQPKQPETILSDMRKTTRNLIRRAEKEGVTIERSTNPVRDLEHFLVLHEETRKRHGFTPYTDQFFRAQVECFAPRNECTLYMARYQGEVISSSIHMHAFGETSYHHGASTHRFEKIPSSYLLQWTAVQDAIKRGDHVYSFWGIAPEGAKKHPFRGVTTFKTGFGGTALPLVHCMDIPLHMPKYALTWGFEMLRKWKRGF